MADLTHRPPDLETLRGWQVERAFAWGRLLVVVMVTLMAGVLARVVQLKVMPDPRLHAAAGSTVASRTDTGRRGDLLDRRGRLVAATTVGYRLFVDPQEVEDLPTVAVDIATLIGVDPIAIDRLIHERPDGRYVVVAPLLEGWQVDAIRGARLRGVGLETRAVRHYPHGNLGAALVGTVGFEHTGLSGLEHRFDERIEAHAGHVTYLRDAQRQPIWIESASYRPGAAGAPVRLSLDLVIQEMAERHIHAAVEARNAAGGRIVVSDPRTGEILALCDILHERDDREPEIVDPARAVHPALGRNRCVTDPYEPGSTFKPFIWAVATELGRADPNEVLPIAESGPHRTSYGRWIEDAHYYGPSTWRQVLVRSMNSGMAIVAERMSFAEMRDALRRFGFGEKTRCGVPGESRGIVTAPGDWKMYTQSSVAMGHEIAVTPVQMVRAFSAFARNGTIPAPRFTAVAGDDGDYAFVRRAVSPDIARLTRETMRLVMTDGTGRRAQSSRYTLFGKSGTAELPRKEGGGYHDDRYVSSFIAGAPFDEPRIVVLCVIDDPDRSRGHYGGEIAGPVVRDLIEEALPYLGVAPDRE